MHVHEHEVLVKDVKCSKVIVSWAEPLFSPPWGFWSFQVLEMATEFLNAVRLHP